MPEPSGAVEPRPQRCPWCGYYLMDDGSCWECIAFGEEPPR